MSSKKKNVLFECKKCSCHLLTKDQARHESFCGTPETSEVSVIVPNKHFKGFTQNIDRFSEYLPSDATGWARMYSILLHPNTMDMLGVSARQPCIMDTPTGRSVVIVWPCKEVGLLKIGSRFAPKERMCDLTPVFEYSTVDRLALRLDKDCPVQADNALREFLEMYLTSAFVQKDVPVTVNYYGQKVKILPEVPLDVAMGKASIDENSVQGGTVMCVAPLCSMHLEIPTTDDLADELGIQADSPMDRIGGMSTPKDSLLDFVIRPHSRGGQCCSVLLWGLPGSGKTMLLRAVADTLGAGAYVVSTLDELVDKVPLLSRRTVLLADIANYPQEHKAYQVIPELMAQNKIACMVMTARSADDVELGVRVRFQLEVEVPVPNEGERVDILGVLTGLRPPGPELVELAQRTHGFTGGDLESVIKTAQYTHGDTMRDKLEAARRRIRPTGIRQFILEVPNVKWADIGGNVELKEEIQQAVIWPQLHPDAFARFGIDPPSGILLYGPPGCSKTLVARALANESKMNFLAVKGPELFNKWVGESEKGVRDLFARARQVAPTIVFFDEIDAVGASRGSENSSGVSDRVLAQLLTELDGLEKQSGVVLLAATNRPDQLDSALLRPGRLDRAIYVGLPCPSTRRAILEMRMKKMERSDDVRVETIVDRTDGYSGAELVALCRTAALIAMRENVHCQAIEWRHFEQSLQAIVPRTEKYMLDIYSQFRKGNVV